MKNLKLYGEDGGAWWWPRMVKVVRRHDGVVMRQCGRCRFVKARVGRHGGFLAA